ncbi:MAG: HIG1 domain-containing protein [Sphingomonadaceae bacterium]|nr:HIG1 domain-containing protein [Sphingomonadaceae bacterium]
MNTILILVIVIIMAMVVVSLVRGVIAFLKSSRTDLENDAEDGGGATEMQLRQNKMMFSRIKYQALAVIVVALLIMASR